MSFNEVYSDDPLAWIQNEIDDADDGVYIHNRRRPAYSQFVPPKEVPNIKVKNKGTKYKPFKIIGIDSNVNKVDHVCKDMPTIKGTSPTIMGADDASSQNCGVFCIGPGCFVEICGLHLVHEIGLSSYPSDIEGSAHGSSTIANLVDEKESSLTISNCYIETYATAAISVRSDTSPGGLGMHNVSVQGCTVTGKRPPGSTDILDKMIAGNYSSVNLGYWGKYPLDMSKSIVEISGCTLNSLFFGVVGMNVTGDSESVFMVAGNSIGTGPEGIALGVSFLSDPYSPVVALPKGTIAILENTIKVGRYLALAGAAGIVVHVKMDMDPSDEETVEEHQRRTIVRGNRIDIQVPATSDTYPYSDGIIYQYETKLLPADVSKYPDVEKDSVQGVTAYIDSNELYSSQTPSAGGPEYGIHLGPCAHLVRVTNNQLTGFKALFPIYISETACRNVFVGNVLSKLTPKGFSGIHCDGSQNSFVDTDFKESGILGLKSAGGAVCITFGENSDENVAVLEPKYVPDGTDPEDQYKPNPAQKHNVVVVLPEFYYAVPFGEEDKLIPSLPPGQRVKPTHPVLPELTPHEVMKAERALGHLTGERLSAGGK